MLDKLHAVFMRKEAASPLIKVATIGNDRPIWESDMGDGVAQ